MTRFDVHLREAECGLREGDWDSFEGKRLLCVGVRWERIGGLRGECGSTFDRGV